LEFRSPDKDQFQALEKALISLAEESAEKFGLGLEIMFQGRHQPAPMSEKAQTAFAAACETLGLGQILLASFAGHDGQSLAKLCPTGMIFVPSVGGASHAPREFTGWQDCVNGANTLLQAALEMAETLT
jgi:N-carbamoyl-L-amino-acid hydrolase